MSVENGSFFEENVEDELSELEGSIVTKQKTGLPETNLKETEEIADYEQDEKEEEEPQASDNEDNLLTLTIPNPKLDLFKWVFGPPPLTRAQSGYQEKIQKRKDKFKKPRFPDRRKDEKDRKKREYQVRISENRNIKEVLDDIDRNEALCVREHNSAEVNYDKNLHNHHKTNKLQDDYAIVKEELIRRSRILDRLNKESLDRAKKDSKYKHNFSKVIKDAEKEIYNTPSLIPGS
ncbi:9238_t:CDS:2 [Acaulospora morrowiae]|uniref:9238_t:CDS:1 n=1 Tax=Acaulospora morrowiae TaxID=94023 RepID=A0A9N8W635_9GLOM|nr:9238_t:CDS:2 [Acaulospora morrowiae]